MEIRRLQVADAAVYQPFRLRGLREHAEAFTSSHEEACLRPLAATPDEKVWGAFVDGEMAGLVGLSRETRLKNRHKASLVGLYVADEFAGRGLGRALVETVLLDARDCGVELIVLTVTDSNQAACALYTRAGFAALGIEPDAIRVSGISFGKQHMFLQLATP